jgi:hypothetical protein
VIKRRAKRGRGERAKRENEEHAVYHLPFPSFPLPLFALLPGGLPPSFSMV